MPSSIPLSTDVLDHLWGLLQEGRIDGLQQAMARAEAQGQVLEAKILKTFLKPEEVHWETEDLLGKVMALVQSSLAGDPQVVDPQLHQLSQENPFLKSLLGALLTQPERILRDPVLGALSPKAEQVRVAWDVMRLYGTVNASTLKKAFGEDLILDLNPEQWPDLAFDLKPHALGVWALGDGPWRKSLEYALKAAFGAEQGLKEALVYNLLKRLEREVQIEAWEVAQTIVWAAEELVGRFEDKGKREALGPMLRDLGLQLEWVVEGRLSGALLSKIWTYEPGLNLKERLILGQKLMEVNDESIPPQVAMGSQLFLMAHLPTDQEALLILNGGMQDLHPEILDTGLKQMKASEHRRRFLTSVHAAMNGQLLRALEGLRFLIQEGGSHLDLLIYSLLRHPLEDHEEEVKGALEEIWPQLQALSLEWYALIVTEMYKRGWMSEAFIALMHRSEEFLGEEDRAKAARLYAIFLSDRESKPLIVEMGRQLRKMSKTQAIEQALRWMSWILFWSLPEMREGLKDLLMPLSRFVLRGEEDWVAAAAIRVAQEGEPLLQGVVQWYLWHRKDFEDARWMGLVHRWLALPAQLERLGVRLLLKVFKEHEGIEDVEALRQAVMEEVGAMMQNPSLGQ